MLAQFISQFVDAAATICLASNLLFGSPNGPTVGRLMSAIGVAAVPLLFAGPLSGYLADRVSRRSILVYGQIVRALVVTSMLVTILVESLAAALVLWGLGLCATRVLYTSRAASIRHLVRRHELVAADSVSLALGAVAGAAGGVIGFVTNRFIGVELLGFVAIGHLAAAVAHRFVGVNLGGGRDHVSADWREVMKHVLGPKVRYAILATSTHRLLFGAVFASVALLGDRLGDGSPLTYAGVVSATGVGAFLGNITAEWVNERLTRRLTTTLAFAAAGCVSIVTVVANVPVVYIAGVALLGFLFQNLRVCSDATIQSNALRGAGGREFALYDVSYNLAYLLGVLAGLGLGEHMGSRVVISTSGTVFALGSLVFVLLPRSADSTSGVESTPSGQPNATPSSSAISTSIA